MHTYFSHNIQGLRPVQRNWVVNPAAVLSRYTPVKIFKTLQGADIHRLENVITLGTDTHGLFGRLDFCLDSTPEPNARTINCRRRCSLIPV